MAGTSKHHVNTFTAGIDQDTSVNKYTNEAYFDALDLRVVSNQTLSNGALCNFPGNRALIELIGANKDVKQYCIIRDALVLFSCSRGD